MSTGAAAGDRPRVAGDAEARTAALGGLIDDAGMYPPARLPRADAVARHRGIRSGPNGWLVARFVCPAADADAVAAAAAGGAWRWRLAVTVAGDTPEAVDAAVAVRKAGAHGGAALEQIEVRLAAGSAEATVARFATIAEAVGTSSAGGDAPLVLCEPPDSTDATAVDATLAAVGAARARGHATGLKIRCGGATAAAVPSVEVVARSLAGAAAADVPVKATAGLHQPFRHWDAALGGWAHGLVNLLAAAALAERGANAATIGACLADDRAAFALDARALRWRDERCGVGSLQRMRARVLRGVGSCDLDEPIGELAALGMLPAPTQP